MNPTRTVRGAGSCARRWVRCVCVCLLLLVAAPRVFSQEPPSEHEVKAVFLYNFAKFVEWPAGAFRDPSSPVVICIVGSDPFGDILDATIRGEKVDGRAIALRRLPIGEELRRCHILFVSSSERRRLDSVFDAIRGAGVLTVGEMDEFTQLGGMVQFTKERFRVGMEINVETAERAQLKISSRLLSLARVVGARPGARRAPE